MLCVSNGPGACSKPDRLNRRYAHMAAIFGERGVKGIPMEGIKVIARFRDGRLLKGLSQSFNPTCPSFFLIPVPSAGKPQPVKVALADLKAVFIVHDFVGKPEYHEQKQFPLNHGDNTGLRLKVTFSDGEVLVGRSLNYDPNAAGFFLLPADPASNNQRVYVVAGAVKSVDKAA